MKLDIVSSLTLHGLTFNRVFGGIYKNEDIKDELYLDSAVNRMGVAGDRVKVQVLVEHLVVMESKWFDLLPRLKPWDSNAICTVGAST